MEEKYSSKKILFFHSDIIILAGLPYAFHSLGYDIIETEFKPHLSEFVLEEVSIIERILDENQDVYLVVTYDFIPVVSIACESKKIKYFAWVYDCPQIELYRPEVHNQYTYISVFDRNEYLYLKSRCNIGHLFYYPLAADVDALTAAVIDENDTIKYNADVSFLGRLYMKNYTQRILDKCSMTYKQRIQKVIHQASCIWEHSTENLFSGASETLIDHIFHLYGYNIDNLDVDSRHFVEGTFFAPLCNTIERTKVLNTLAEHYSVTLYTNEKKLQGLNSNIKMGGEQSYWEEMPKVFGLSKINLNITSKSMTSGVPQRIWDILAVGGFCMTNYQPEIYDYFIDGRELVVYHTLSELIELTDYYLKNEDERLRIGINGYRKVKEIGDMVMRMADVIEQIDADR